MTQRRVSFTHDGHRFEAVEQVAPAGDGATAAPRYRWTVTMDGEPALDFSGEFPYRDPDVQKRVVEWYGIQKPTGI